MNNNSINVGFCENGAGYGGAIISLAAFLEKIPSEFRPHLFTSLGTDPYRRLERLGRWRHMPAQSLLDPARLRHGAPFASTLDNVFNMLPYALRYYRAFRKGGVDLVYLNNDCSCNMAAAVGARLARLPLVLHARGFNADTRGNRWVLQHIDHCIAVSRAVKRELIELGLPAEKCTVVPEGLDLTQFHPQAPDAVLRGELGLAEDEPVITLVGGLIDWKGQDVLIEATPAILEAFPDAVILLVGSAYGKDNRYAEDITRKAGAPALRGRVRLLGARQDIPVILSISSVVLHASTKPEPFGRTFLEGMAMGKPTIASNEGGPLDVIEHEVDGLLIEPRKPAVLATAVKRLLSDPVLSASLGEHAARKARNYSIEHHTKTISTVLHRVMQSRRTGFPPPSQRPHEE
ncbi:glycosyltransferase family 4 protein [Telluria aromaticivorans]|uniref:Glycosyltransferase family 4 protein n=1 Tax=Telluria aromaticivorans TaxID=2725995 RepID=A0A7Y2K171_9BURK|nr:glycosyltransferase family 4 protein [Telluria aromaticivorans]NNG24213.1 glycosyltransferase family 4 protein [Telluria aromaticivorans]